MKSFYPNVSRLLAVAVLATGMAACDSMPTREAYTTVLDNAEAAVRAGKVDSALVSFDEAAKADPTSKEPWVRIAQLQFDAGNYGRAIVAAEEVLQRDPNDQVADSVLTVAGLRIASESLERLQGAGALASATARTEAERLAATMRATMGDGILDTGPAKSKSTRSRPTSRPTRTTTAPAAKPEAATPPPAKTISNPFD